MQFEFDLRNKQGKSELARVKSWSFGGVPLKKRTKTQRPLILGRWTHVILKSKRARGEWSLLKADNRARVASLLKTVSRRFFVEVKAGQFINMGNHLHLVVRFNDRKRFGKFLKSFAAQIARRVTGACRGNPVGPFWDGLAFTRVLTTRIEELQIRGYIKANGLERELGPSAREAFLADWNAFIAKLKRVRAKARDPGGTS